MNDILDFDGSTTDLSQVLIFYLICCDWTEIRFGFFLAPNTNDIFCFFIEGGLFIMHLSHFKREKLSLFPGTINGQNLERRLIKQGIF